MKFKVTMSGEDLRSIVEAFCQYNRLDPPEEIKFFGPENEELIIDKVEVATKGPRMVARMQPEELVNELTPEEVAASFSGLEVSGANPN